MEKILEKIIIEKKILANYISNMSCRNCGKKFTSIIDAVQHLNQGCNTEQAIDAIQHLNQGCNTEQATDAQIQPKNRNGCPLCGEQFSDTSVFARLNHKCAQKEDIPEPMQSAPVEKAGKTKTECQYCHKQFIKIDRHYENCKKKNPVAKKQIQKEDETPEPTETPKTWHCNVCNTDMKYYQQFKHIQTKTHLNNAEKSKQK
jgi:hypothetical protein